MGGATTADRLLFVLQKCERSVDAKQIIDAIGFSEERGGTRIDKTSLTKKGNTRSMMDGIDAIS